MRYVAFLRAINVGGHTVRMETLRGLFERFGATAVETFIASGNVVFESGVRPESVLEERIESALEEALQFPVGTFLRTLPEVAAVAESTVFPDDDVKAAHALYVGFLKKAPDRSAVATITNASTRHTGSRSGARDLLAAAEST